MLSPTDRMRFLFQNRNFEDIKEILDKRDLTELNAEGLLHLAARKNRVDLIHYLIKDHHLDVNARLPSSFLNNDIMGETPLAIALQAEQYQAVEALLQNNANVNLPFSIYPGDIYKTLLYPLHLAASIDHPRFAKLLLEYGARIDDVNQANETPCFLACAASNAELLELFMSHYANLYLQSTDHLCPMDFIKLSKKLTEIYNKHTDWSCYHGS